jgi:hypothetical protein
MARARTAAQVRATMIEMMIETMLSEDLIWSIGSIAKVRKVLPVADRQYQDRRSWRPWRRSA